MKSSDDLPLKVALIIVLAAIGSIIGLLWFVAFGAHLIGGLLL